MDVLVLSSMKMKQASVMLPPQQRVLSLSTANDIVQNQPSQSLKIIIPPHDPSVKVLSASYASASASAKNNMFLVSSLAGAPFVMSASGFHNWHKSPNGLPSTNPVMKATATSPLPMLGSAKPVALQNQQPVSASLTPTYLQPPTSATTLMPLLSVPGASITSPYPQSEADHDLNSATSHKRSHSLLLLRREKNSLPIVPFGMVFVAAGFFTMTVTGISMCYDYNPARMINITSLAWSLLNMCGGFWCIAAQDQVFMHFPKFASVLTVSAVGILVTAMIPNSSLWLRVPMTVIGILELILGVTAVILAMKHSPKDWLEASKCERAQLAAENPEGSLASPCDHV